MEAVMDSEIPKPAISYGRLFGTMKKQGVDPDIAAGSMVDEDYHHLLRLIGRQDEDYGQKL
jgi:hypothetical protein